MSIHKNSLANLVPIKPGQKLNPHGRPVTIGAERYNFTLPPELIARVDKVSNNRSKAIREALELWLEAQ